MRIAGLLTYIYILFERDASNSANERCIPLSGLGTLLASIVNPMHRLKYLDYLRSSVIGRYSLWNQGLTIAYTSRAKGIVILTRSAFQARSQLELIFSRGRLPDIIFFRRYDSDGTANALPSYPHLQRSI